METTEAEVRLVYHMLMVKPIKCSFVWSTVTPRTMSPFVGLNHDKSFLLFFHFFDDYQFMLEQFVQVTHLPTLNLWMTLR